VFTGETEYRDSVSINSYKRSNLGAMDVRRSAREERQDTRRSRRARVREDAREEQRGERRRNSRSQRRSTEVASLGDFGTAIGNALHGIASFYWQPQRVASGGWFNPNAMTAAHKTLRFGTRVRVTHLGNGRSVVVTINDRGPYIRGRIIDLSKAAAGVIGMQGQGVARVRVDVVSSR
jgi:rare lipoprotein A